MIRQASVLLIWHGWLAELMNHREYTNMYPIEIQEISGDLNVKNLNIYLGTEKIQR
jgi:hypothetical protein